MGTWPRAPCTKSALYGSVHQSKQSPCFHQNLKVQLTMMHLDGRSGQDRQKASSIKTLSLMQQFLKAQMTGVIFQATESRICHHHRLLEWMSCGNRPEIVGGQACTGTRICQPMNVSDFEPCSMSARMCHVPSWSLQIPV